MAMVRWKISDFRFQGSARDFPRIRKLELKRRSVISDDTACVVFRAWRAFRGRRGPRDRSPVRAGPEARTGDGTGVN